MDSIVSLHLEEHRPFPRPRDLCDGCGQEMVLCWGDQRNPYWRHLSNPNNMCKGSGESLTHKLAKSLLTQYLNKGGHVHSQHSCQRQGRQCPKAWPEINIGLQEVGITMFVEEFQLDTAGGRVVYDIAGVDSASQVKIGVEIRKSHITNRIPTSVTIPWLEVSAQEVLEQLDVGDTPAMITLTKLNNQRYCDAACKYLVKNQAFHLGYLQIDRLYLNDTSRLVDAAMRGKYRSTRERWELTVHRLPYGSWDAFLELKVCIRCEKKNNEVRVGKPYCLTCYKITAREIDQFDGFHSYHEKVITPQDKYRLRQRFAWLGGVPGNWKKGVPCHYCGVTDPQQVGSNAASYVWWFGEKKCCCTDCLEKIDQHWIATNHATTSLA